MLLKNAIQKVHVYAYDSTTGAAKTGDAAQITGYVSLDGTANAIDDTNPAEVDTTNLPGVYVFDVTAAETNCDAWALYAKSSTANIRIEPIIGFTTAGTAASLTAAVASIANDAITDAAIATGAIAATAFAAGAIDAAAIAADAGTEIGTAVWATAARTLTAGTNITGVTLAADQAVNVTKIGGQATTAAAPVAVLASVGTAATSTAQTGDSFARIGAAGVGLTGITGVTLAATQTGVTIPTVTTLTNLPAIPDNWLTAAGINADAITAAKLHADVTTELQTGLATAAQVAAIGSGSGAAMNFAPSSDNASTAIKTIAKVGTQTGTYANCTADNGVYHVITNAADNLDWIYGYSVGPGRVGSQLTWIGYVAASALASAKAVTVSVYNFATPGWDTVRTIPGQAGTTDVTVDIPMLAAHTGTGAEAGVCYVRFSATAQAGIVLNTDMVLIQAQNLGQTVGYSQGSIWVKATGTAGTTPYVNGTADNPCPWANALTLSAALGITQFEISPGTTITLTADLKSASLSGHGWFLDLAGYDISYTRIEGCEGLTGTATAADHEAFIYSSHIAAVTLGEVDIHDSHLVGVVTLSAEKPYLIEHCVGVPMGVPTLAFGATADARAVVVTSMGGQLLVTGMRAGNVLIFDGDCDLTMDATNTGGTVSIAGNVRLTYNGTGQTVIDSARWSEDQSIASVTGAVGSVTGDTKQTADVATLIATVGVAGAGLTGTGIPAATVTALGTGSGLTALATATELGAVHTHVGTIEAFGAPPAVSAIADGVWDEALAGHAGAGSAGLALATASSGGVDPSVLADAIWDEALSGHSTAGTAGKKLTDLANADLSGVATATALSDLHTDVGTAISDIAATHVHAAAADTQTTPTALRLVVGLATANLDTQLAALPTDADVNAACDTAISDAALATAANLATVDGVVDAILTESQSHPTLAEIEASTTLAKVGSNMGTVASVTGAVGSVTAPVTAGTVSDKTGYALSSAGVTAIWAEVVEGTITAVQAVRGILATAIGKLSGAATTTITIRDASDTKARVTATVDADGNRTAITKDLT